MASAVLYPTALTVAASPDMIKEAEVVNMDSQNSVFNNETGAVYYPPGIQDSNSLRKRNSYTIGVGVSILKIGQLRYVGRMIVPKRITIIVLLKGAIVDLSEAQFIHPQTTVSVVALFGGCRVIVPVGVTTRVSGVAILGGFTEQNPHDQSLIRSASPTVIVNGMSMCGGVKVIINTLRPPVMVSSYM